MAVKTITITNEAYFALKSLKADEESFSKAIMRIAKKKSLRSFFGVLDTKSADKLEYTINDLRKTRNNSRKKRLSRLI